MPTKRRRRVNKKHNVTGFQSAILDISNPRGYIRPDPLGMGTGFDSEDHVRECWHQVREEIIRDRWTEPDPGAQELWLDRQGMPTAFWLYDAPDIDEKRRDGESDRELLERFGITDAQGTIAYPTVQPGANPGAGGRLINGD